MTYDLSSCFWGAVCVRVAVVCGLKGAAPYTQMLPAGRAIVCVLWRRVVNAASQDEDISSKWMYLDASDASSSLLCVVGTRSQDVRPVGCVDCRCSVRQGLCERESRA